MRNLYVCDACKVKTCDNGVGSLFLDEHVGHNFTGCRVVEDENPCPNRVRDYTEVEWFHPSGGWQPVEDDDELR